MKNIIQDIEDVIINIRKIKPLILSITNYVTMDIIANCLLAIGAKPLMSVCATELEELVKISHAINVNIGTIDTEFVARCNIIANLSKKYNKPLIFDPVGAGATTIRTKTAQEFVKHANIVRGNASEIMALLDDKIKTCGVESLNTTENAKESSFALAKRFNLTVIVSGEEDFITDGINQQSLFFGSKLMPLVTGMGCALTSVISAFRSVVNDPFKASKLATAYFGLCGNLTEFKCNNPGKFRTEFIDTLYSSNFFLMEKFLFNKST